MHLFLSNKDINISNSYVPTIPYRSTNNNIYGFTNGVYNTLYTVPVGKTLYVGSADMSVKSTTSAFAYGVAYVYNKDSVFQFTLLRAHANNVTVGEKCISFPIPLKIPEEWIIKLYSNSSLCYVYICIFAYEE